MSNVSQNVTGPTNAWARLLRRTTPPARVGVVLVVAYVFLALLAPFVAPYDPAGTDLMQRLAPPSWAGGTSAHLLGTDQLGRDVLSRLIFGSRIALLVSMLGVCLAALVGVTLGLLAGYSGGWVDAIVMRLVDTLMSIPNILLYLTALGVFGPSLITLCLVIGLVNWTTFARVIRAEVLAVRQREYVEASRALGQRTAPILVRHILPNVVGQVLVVATLNIASVIILEASLSFLGLGAQPPAVTWGRMLAEGRSYLASAWWLATFPGIAITVLVLALIFVGDWLRDVFDPRT
jgi:peptide/nickel transport system permease protein